MGWGVARPFWILLFSSGWLSVSGSEKAKQGGILAHNGGWTLKRDRASLHHIDVLRHPQRELHMLLYKDHTHSAREFGQAVCDLLNDADPHSFGGLIEH